MSQLPQIFEKILSDLEKIDLTGLDSGTRVSSQNDFVISLLEDLFLNFVFYLAQREGKPLSGISSTKAAQLYINRIRTEFDCPNHMGWELALEIKELGIEESIQKILNS